MTIAPWSPKISYRWDQSRYITKCDQTHLVKMWTSQLIVKVTTENNNISLKKSENYKT